MEDNTFLELAIQEAKKGETIGEVPVGAVIVKDGKVITSAHNLKETQHDATAHAEILAIKKASQILGDWRLIECEIYVTLEPCAMCASAILHARLKRVVYGVSDPKWGGETKLNLFSEKQFSKWFT